jgi:hypothetical protein
MTRKDFLKTVGTSAVTAAVASSFRGDAASPAPPQAAGLKRGVTLYSYQEAYYTHAMNLEDCLREASSIGAYQIQLLPEEMVPDFPNPSDQWVGQWKEWMAKYRLVADTYCQFQDTVLTKGVDLPIEQGLAMMERDFKLAKRMGFHKARMLNGTDLTVLEKGIPLAEKYDIWMGMEVHAPTRLDGKLVHRWIEIADRNKTKHLGILPDFSIFQYRPTRVQRDRQIRDGALTPDIATYIEEAFVKQTPKADVAAEVARRNPKPGDKLWVETVYRIKMDDPQIMVQLKDYLQNCHAKFWEMTEDYHEYSIDYKTVIPVMVKGGITATLSSEYEGQRSTQDAFETDECEQIRRQHVMLRRLLGEV